MDGTQLKNWWQCVLDGMLGTSVRVRYTEYPK